MNTKENAHLKNASFSFKDLVDDNAVITDSEDDDSMDVEEESAAVECEMREDELDAQVRRLSQWL